MTTTSSSNSAVNDAALPGDPFTRVSYHYGQLLEAEDFESEQRYFLLRSRLSNALLHGMGVVWGLKIEPVSKPDGKHTIANAINHLGCTPGLAIDGLGRELCVKEPLYLDLGPLETTFWQELSTPPDQEKQTNVKRAYLVLSYQSKQKEPIPIIQPPAGTLKDDITYARFEDGCKLCLMANGPSASLATAEAVHSPGDEHMEHLCSPKQRLLELCLNRQENLERFWSPHNPSSLEFAVLVAVIDLEAVNPPEGIKAEGLQYVKLRGTVNNGVRPLLPSLHTSLDLLWGGSWRGERHDCRFQVTDLRIAGQSHKSGGDQVCLEVVLSAPLNANSLTYHSVRLLAWEPPNPCHGACGDHRWAARACRVKLAKHDGCVIRIEIIDPLFPPTPFQVLLEGTGRRALLDQQGRVLAGVIGELAPPGTGRNVCLTGLYQHTPASLPTTSKE
jgi:hypothetical protein